MKLDLDNKTALVTGSTKGIGFAIAQHLLTEGARVIINGRSADSTENSKKELLKAVPNAKIETFAGDLSSEEAAQKLVLQFPKVDILVNNLGIFEERSFQEISDADWRRFFEVNVLSGVRLSRAYLPSMKEKNWGRIIFISSESGVQIPVEMIHYGMTKTAQLAVSRGLAETCVGTGVTVNSVLPGPTKTAGVDDFVAQLSKGQSFEKFEKEFFDRVRPTSLLKRFETVDEIASLVTFVCSPVSSGINGAALRVDGGVVRSCI